MNNKSQLNDFKRMITGSLEQQIKKTSPQKEFITDISIVKKAVKEKKSRLLSSISSVKPL